MLLQNVLTKLNSLGRIPTIIGALTNLGVLDVDTNRLTGLILIFRIFPCNNEYVIMNILYRNGSYNSCYLSEID